MVEMVRLGGAPVGCDERLICPDSAGLVSLFLLKSALAASAAEGVTGLATAADTDKHITKRDRAISVIVGMSKKAQ